jgi:hypothetical protein
MKRVTPSEGSGGGMFDARSFSQESPTPMADVPVFIELPSQIAIHSSAVPPTPRPDAS